MADVVTPHLKYPFRWGFNGHAEVVEQGSDDDLVQCAFGVLNTKLGSRVEVPTFGARLGVLEENGPSLPEMEAALLEWEPRAVYKLTDEQYQDLKSKLVNVGVGVNPNG